MTKHFLNTLLFSVCLLAFAGCSKDDEEKVSPNLKYLTGGVWTGSAVYFNGDDITEEIETSEGFDVSAYTSSFDKNGTYNDSYDGQAFPEGTWRFDNDERAIVFDEGTADEYSVVISRLNNNELFYLQDGYEFRFVR